MRGAAGTLLSRTFFVIMQVYANYVELAIMWATWVVNPEEKADELGFGANADNIIEPLLVAS